MRRRLVIVVAILPWFAYAQEPTSEELKDVPNLVRLFTDSALVSVGQRPLTDCQSAEKDPSLPKELITWPCNVAIGFHALWKTMGRFNVAIGACAGADLEEGSRDTLIGPHTSTPTPHTSDFVNIGNKLCFWATTGECTACPPPAECPKSDH